MPKALENRDVSSSPPVALGPAHAGRFVPPQSAPTRVEARSTTPDSAASSDAASDGYSPTSSGTTSPKAPNTRTQLPPPKGQKAPPSPAPSLNSTASSAGTHSLLSRHSTPLPPYSGPNPLQFTIEPQGLGATAAPAAAAHEPATTAPQRSAEQPPARGQVPVGSTGFSPIKIYGQALAYLSRLNKSIPLSPAARRRIRRVALSAVQMAAAAAPLVVFCALCTLPGGLFALGAAVLLLPLVTVAGYKLYKTYQYLKARLAKSQDAGS